MALVLWVGACALWFLAPTNSASQKRPGMTISEVEGILGKKGQEIVIGGPIDVERRRVMHWPQGNQYDIAVVFHRRRVIEVRTHRPPWPDRFLAWLGW
jgi:hypothetical protein